MGQTELREFPGGEWSVEAAEPPPVAAGIVAGPDPHDPAAMLAAIHAGADGDTRRAGREWYPAQWRRCQRLARRHGTTARRVAAVLAACSPRVTLKNSWSLTEDAFLPAQSRRTAAGALPSVSLARGRWAGPGGGHFSHVRDKVSRLLKGERPLAVLRGPKCTAFYRNLTGDPDAVTIDVWAARAVGLARAPESPAAYERVAEHYREAARRVGETPRDLQAIVWVALRGRAD